MKTAFEIAGPVVVCGWLLAAFIRCFMTSEPTAEPNPNAWIDNKIAAETDPGRRAAWRMLRNDTSLEEL